MAGYPVILDLSGRLAVVVGGGAVGRRKVTGLLAAGARVRLISSAPVPPSCWREPVEFHLRPFHPSDLDGAMLAFAATGVATVDDEVLAAARARGIPANLATRPESGDFSVPAVLRRGDLLVAVTTGGGSPALAGLVRDRLETALGPEWALVVAIATRLRKQKLTTSAGSTYYQKVLVELLDAGLAELLACGEATAVDQLLTRVCGRDFSLAGLGLTLPDPLP